MYEDKSYDWTLKGPPSSWYIKQATGLARGADRTGHETVGTISLKHLYEIAKVCGLCMCSPNGNGSLRAFRCNGMDKWCR